MALVFALLAAAAAQEPVLAEGRAWLSIQLVEVSATAPDTRARGAITPDIDWTLWRPLGFDDQGPYGRIERFDVQQVPGDRSLRLEVARDEFVDIVAHGPSHGVAELRVAPDTARIVGGRPRDRAVELKLPLSSDERGRVEVELTHDGTVPIFNPWIFGLVELSPTGRFQTRVARFEEARDAGGLGRSTLALAVGRHTVAIDSSPFMLCGVGPAQPNRAVITRMTVDVVPGAVIRWAPVVSRGTSLALRIERAGIVAPTPSNGLSFDVWELSEAPADGRELDRWCAARLIARDTGEVHEPQWGWSLQSVAFPSGVFPLAVDVYTIERYPPGRYTLEVRGPGMKLLTHELTLAAPEMEPLVLKAMPR